MIKRAEVKLELELEKQIDYASCSDAEKEAITMLAAILVICCLSGGTAIGMNFSIGDQYISVLTKAPSLHVLERQLDKIVSQLKNLCRGLGDCPLLFCKFLFPQNFANITNSQANQS